MKYNSVVKPALALAPLLLVACTLSLFRPAVSTPATSTPWVKPLESSTAPPSSNPTGEAAVTVVPTGGMVPSPAANGSGFCSAEAPRTLISTFRSAIMNSDGELLASLISPTHGMDARLFRDGRVVNYDADHAAALFASTFSLNWGNAPGSGLPTVGSFKQLFVPDLLDVLNREYVLGCDQVLVGGTTYTALWPYAGIDFYSLYFPGTEAFGHMDWHTWLLGMHDAGGTPRLYAIMQFKWEP